MFLSYRKKLLGCGLVLLVCLWVIYRTSQLAFQYDKLLASMQWEADRCIHKQGVDSMARVGSVDVFSHLSLGVYPEGLVSVSPAVLHHTARYFSSRAPEHLLKKVSDQLSSLIWPLSATSDPWPMCTHYHDEGYVFLVSAPNQRDWYHTLHTSTLLPLYALLTYRRHLGPHSVHGYSVALLPAVENYKLQSVDWSSPVLGETGEHGAVQEVLRAFAGHMSIVPLSVAPAPTTTCFMTLHFGVPSVNLSDPFLLSGFVKLMLSQLSLVLTRHTQPIFCFVVGSLTERFLNLPELVEAAKERVTTQTIDCSGLSYREQVSQVQLCTILAGFHGNDLMNALYMPANSVTIRLLSSIQEEIEHNTKYTDIARTRGHYLEWTNPNEDSRVPGKDITDTTMDVKSFITLIDHALTLGINNRLRT